MKSSAITAAPKMRPSGLKLPTAMCFIQMMPPTAMKKAAIAANAGHGLGSTRW